MIKQIIDDFYFRNYGFKKENISFALTTIKNYEKYIEGNILDTPSMKRYIKRVKKHFNIFKMDVKKYYCEINNSQQANEVKELLINTGEDIKKEHPFWEVSEKFKFLKFASGINEKGCWYISYMKPDNSTQLTYTQLNEMLNEKIKENG